MTATVNMTKSNFHFKTEKLRDEKGAVIGEGKKHPSVEIDLPVPTKEFLAEMLLSPEQFPKEVELIMQTITDQVYRVARGQINDFRENTKDAVVTAASLNYDKLDWTAIANMPKSERASTVPAEDDIKNFLASYLEIMPTALNKPKANIENHLLCFQTSFKKQRSQKEILEMFQNSLAVYTATAGDAAIEDHMEVIEYFGNRLDKLLKSEEKITMENL
jgi:hypothetical protein